MCAVVRWNPLSPCETQDSFFDLVVFGKTFDFLRFRLPPKHCSIRHRCIRCLPVMTQKQMLYYYNTYHHRTTCRARARACTKYIYIIIWDCTCVFCIWISFLLSIFTPLPPPPQTQQKNFIPSPPERDLRFLPCTMYLYKYIIYIIYYFNVNIIFR